MTNNIVCVRLRTVDSNLISDLDPGFSFICESNLFRPTETLAKNI